tara:strand:+ start:960 stop:1796 length:837 start_codon:yes stop_codon:yes gene_type:complete
MSKTLYVTSFNKKIFKFTGKRMIDSFLHAGVEGDLLVTHEEGIAEDIQSADNIVLFDLDSDPFLHNWLDENKDIIFEEFGGTFKGCDCDKLPASKHYLKGHVRHCPGLGFNKRACFWFRKIAAMKEAMRIANEDNQYDRVVFIDSDVVFKTAITESYMDSIFKGAGFFFHLGPHRSRIQTGIESGFIGFSRANKGFDFLQMVIDSFVTKDFRRFDRWDDGYVFRKVWEEHPEIPSKDVVGNHPLKPYAHVVRYGAFAKYLEHEKGSHTRKYGLFERPV